jgi:hypothetical protein
VLTASIWCGEERRKSMEDFAKPTELLVAELMADLSPEELEPRLELQVFIDPLMSLVTAVDNNNNNNNKPVPIFVIVS